MNLASLEAIRGRVVVNAGPDETDEVHRLLAQAGAVLQGHFALQSGWHADHIFRIRGFARHLEALARLGDLLVARAGVSLDGVTLLCPESAGYLLADQIAKQHQLPLAVARVDLLRRPTQELVPESKTSRYLGTIAARSKVVIVNDVASTGASLDTLKKLAESRDATVEGVLVLGTSQGATIRLHLQQHRLPGNYLLEGLWNNVRPEGCPKCLAHDRSILPVAEFN
jgi:orotate phosphoribosyltransferase